MGSKGGWWGALLLQAEDGARPARRGYGSGPILGPENGCWQPFWSAGHSGMGAFAVLTAREPSVPSRKSVKAALCVRRRKHISESPVCFVPDAGS